MPAPNDAPPAAHPRRSVGRFALLLLAVLAAFAASVRFGSVTLSNAEVVDALRGVGPSTNRSIVVALRIPKALTALLAGAGLAVSGLVMQTLFRNPLAGPFVLGLHSGASLGVALVVLVGGGSLAAFGALGALGSLGNLGIVVAASLGAGAVLLVVLFAARRVHTLTLLILGVLLGYAVSALVTVLLHFSSAERLQAFMVWTFGSFAGVTWRQLQVLAPTLLVATAAAHLVARPLDALLLGEDAARSLGVPLAFLRRFCLSLAAVLAGAVTAYCGPIGFLGVAVPHMARALFGTAEHRVLLPASALCGGATALVADLVATLPGSSSVLPLNAVTALVGAPTVAWVLLRRPPQAP